MNHLRKDGNWLPEDLPTVLNNLGLLYLELHRYEEAQEMLTESLSIRENSLSEEHPSYLSTLNNLALVYHHQKDFQKAEYIYRKVLDIRKKVLYKNHPDIAQSMFNLGILFLEGGQIEQALAIIKEQFLVEDNVLQDVFSVSSEQERLAYVMKLRQTLDTFLLMFMNYSSDEPKAICLAFDIVLRRKGIVMEALKKDRWQVYDSQNTESMADLASLNELRTRISKAILDGPKDKDYPAHEAMISQMQVERNRIEARLVRELSKDDDDNFIHKADRHSVAAALNKDSVLIEIVKWDLPGSFNLNPNKKDQAAYSAFVLAGGEPDQLQLYHFGLADTSGDTLGLEKAVELFRDAVTFHAQPGRSSLNFEALAKQERALGIALREVLIDRLLPTIGDRKRLYISPDGILNSLPFEALPLDDSGYISDNFVISYLSSGREILQNDKAVTFRQSDPVVVANPAFDLPGDMVAVNERKTLVLNFLPLEDTDEEGQWIANEIGATVFKNDQALKSIVKNCQSPRILHFATHGFFIPKGQSSQQDASFYDPMLQSGIALAGANNWLNGKTLPVAAGDGLLTAEDVCSMNLLGTELVVLSTCESGLGEYQSGEGIFGLRRAFELAGAHSLVISLWKVPGEPTQILMKEFYRQLLSGKTRVDSLRVAKAILRRRFSEVFYWAGFVLSGNSTSIY
jgi:CHAT domain-containing protein